MPFCVVRGYPELLVQLGNPLCQGSICSDAHIALRADLYDGPVVEHTLEQEEEQDREDTACRQSNHP